MFKTNVSIKFKNHDILSITIGIVYLWFGALKFIPGYSPAEQLAADVIQFITFGLIPQDVAIILLAVFEVILGLALIFRQYKKVIIFLTLGHISCTFLPLFIFPDKSFKNFPLGLTLTGQYILKNIIIISSLITIYSQNKNLKVDT